MEFASIPNLFLRDFDQNNFTKVVGKHPMWWIRPKTGTSSAMNLWKKKRCGGNVLLFTSFWDQQTYHLNFQIYLIIFLHLFNANVNLRKSKKNIPFNLAGDTSWRWHLGDTPVPCFLTTIAPQSTVVLAEMCWCNGGQILHVQTTCAFTYIYIYIYIYIIYGYL